MDSNAGVVPAPPGVIAHTDYNGPDGKALALAISCITISTLFVPLRVLAKVRAIKKLNLDDWFFVAGYCGAIVYFGINLYANSLGFGRHLWDVPVSKFAALLRWFTVANLLYLVPTLFLKTSFFFSFLHFFGRHKSMKYLCWFGMSCCTAFYIAIFFVTLFSSAHRKTLFDVSAHSNHRRSLSITLASGVFNCISDLYITVVPMPYIWSLHISHQKRLRVAIIFSMGIFCTAASLARLVLTIEFANEPDAFYSYWFIAICAHVEVLIGLVAASYMVMPLIMDKIIKPFVNSVSRTTHTRNSISSGASKGLHVTLIRVGEEG